MISCQLGTESSSVMANGIKSPVRSDHRALHRAHISLVDSSSRKIIYHFSFLDIVAPSLHQR
jgi:hypothetical protein